MTINAQQMSGGTRDAPAATLGTLVDPRPVRLGTRRNIDGALETLTSAGPGYVFAPATVLANNTTTKVRVQIGAFTTLYVLVKFSACTGTIVVNGYPMLADATKDESVGTRKPIGLPTALSITNTTAQEMSYTCKGEEFFEVEVVVPSGGGATCTVGYIDVYGA